jgi:glycosyltransferase involved in cell wall biosynthesis
LAAEEYRGASREDFRPTILVLLGCFGTGIEATGPNQNLLGMVQALEDRYRFRVAAEAVAGDTPGEWRLLNGVEQIPLRPRPFGVEHLGRLLRETPHEVIITNGFFDKGFTIPLLIMRKLGLVPRTPVLLGAHGEFSPGALTIRAGKKRAYLQFCRKFGLLDGIALQATSEIEADEIRAGLPFFRGEVVVTPIIRFLPPVPRYVPRPAGAPLRVAFLSRIDRKKNLHYALDRLAEFDVPVDFRIFGPVTHEDYWQECRGRIDRLPAHIKAHHEGNLPQSKIQAALAAQDLLFLPTLGENFGHAIADALSAGTPVLISDRTPWRNLEAQGAGWDLPLEDPAGFVAVLRKVAAMNETELRSLRESARAYVERELDPAVPAQVTERVLAACRSEGTSRARASH